MKSDPVEREEVGDFQLLVALHLFAAQCAQLDAAHVAAVVGKAVEVERRLIRLAVVRGELRQRVGIRRRFHQLVDDSIERLTARQPVFRQPRDFRRGGDIADDLAPEGMERANRDAVESRSQPRANLLRCFAVERQNENLLCKRSLVVDQVRDFADDYARFACAGTGEHERRFFFGRNCRRLLVRRRHSEQRRHRIMHSWQRRRRIVTVRFGAGALELVGHCQGVDVVIGL